MNVVDRVFILAVKLGLEKHVKSLLDEGADVNNSLNKEGHTALTQASYCSDFTS